METVFVFSRRVVGLRSKRPARLRAVVAMTAVAALAVGGCSRGESPHSSAAGAPAVVASTDVWGSVAQAIAGDDAQVSSIITSGSADPHSFEPSPVNAAQLADASIVVYNGGGYDPWVDAVLRNHRDVQAVDAYSLLNAESVGEPQPANEHVFYDLGTATAVAGDLAAKLAAADPQKSSQYLSRAKDFAGRVDAIRAAEDQLRSVRPGAAVVATEPVAHYLLRAAGLTDKTPPGFTAAAEQDTDPAPADMAAMLDLIKSRSVAAVIFNDQTVTAATRQVQAAAQEAGVPIVSVTETLPAGVDYLTWQSDTVKRLADALRESR